MNRRNNSIGKKYLARRSTFARSRSARSLAVLIASVALVLGGLAAPASAHGSYTIKSGDTLSEIARDHGVSTKALMAENGISDPNRIRVGQTLSIPHEGDDSGEKTPVAAPAPAPASGGSYTVVSGDTLGAIASKYKSSVKEMAELNGLAAPYVLRVGQVLKTPGGAANYPNLPKRLLANPERLELIGSFERWAAHYEVSPQLAMTVAWQESGWQTNLTSSAGAYGVGQIMPATGEWLANDVIGIPELDRTVPDDNIRMMVRYLKWLENYLGSQDLAIAGYYQGPGATTQGKMYDETVLYVDNVNAQLKYFKRS